MKAFINILGLFLIIVLSVGCGITSKQQVENKCDCEAFKKNIQDNWVYDESSGKSYIQNYSYDSYIGLDSMNTYLNQNTNRCLIGESKKSVQELFSIPLDKKGMHMVYGDRDCFKCLTDEKYCNLKILKTQCSSRIIHIGFGGRGNAIMRAQATYDINGISLDFILTPY